MTAREERRSDEATSVGPAIKRPGSVQQEVAADLPYEQARDELLDVIRALESGGIALEESLALWERGEQLAQVCQRWLDGARARLDASSGGD